jgi:CheY-like chemotaxis protein
MPRLDGIATVQRLRESEWKNTPAVALTAFAMSTDEERILKSGFDGYVTKPITATELRSKIEKFLSGSDGHE